MHFISGSEVNVRSLFATLKQGAGKFWFDISQLMLGISSALIKKVLEMVSFCLKAHSTLKKHIHCVSRCHMKSPYLSQGKTDYPIVAPLLGYGGLAQTMECGVYCTGYYFVLKIWLPGGGGGGLLIILKI
jgi:hypothetical protein